VDLEQAERTAMADFYRAAPPELVEREGIAFLEDDGLLALSVVTLSGSRMFNHAVGITSEDDLDKVDRFYRSRGCAYFVSPAHGVTLDRLIAHRGFVVDYAWMKFERDAERLSSASSLRVEPVGPEHAATLGRITSVAFGAPAWMANWVAALADRDGWTCFLSFAGDEPVGAGIIYVSGPAAWLGFGATLPEHRGKGSQSAIFAARITHAKEQGCTVVVTETGEKTGSTPSASYRNILRAGFSEAYLRPNWASHAPSA